MIVPAAKDAGNVAAGHNQIYSTSGGLLRRRDRAGASSSKKPIHNELRPVDRREPPLRSHREDPERLSLSSGHVGIPPHPDLEPPSRSRPFRTPTSIVATPTNAAYLSAPWRARTSWTSVLQITERPTSRATSVTSRGRTTSIRTPIPRCRGWTNGREDVRLGDDPHQASPSTTGSAPILSCETGEHRIVHVSPGRGSRLPRHDPSTVTGRPESPRSAPPDIPRWSHSSDPCR